MKYFTTTCLLAIALSIGCNDNDNNTTKTTPTPKKDSTAYRLPIPQGWTTEKINFPIEFAPQIAYKGVEDLRFAPGWGMTKADEYWTYSFLWYLNEKPTINETILQDNLVTYYTGLVGSNVTPRSIPPSKEIPVVSTIKKIETAKGDVETYSGSVTMTDYMDLMFNPITLNCIIHKKNCGANTAVIFSLSPKPFEHVIWQTLNGLNTDFSCQN